MKIAAAMGPFLAGVSCFAKGPTMKIVLYVLAVIGALAVLALLGTFLMRWTMMSGMM